MGELLVDNVRDTIIRSFDNAQTGSRNDSLSKHLYELGQNTSAEAREYASLVIPHIVDKTLESILFLLENSYDDHDFAFCYKADGEFIRIDEVSDGLSGEYWEWVKQFSKEREDAISQSINNRFLKELGSDREP